MAEIKKSRNSSVELLRIIAMLFIIISHYCVHSGIDRAAMEFSFNRTLLQWGGLGNLGVVMFVMITGYFMCSSKLKIKSLFRTASAAWFYSAVFLVIFLLWKGMTLEPIIRALFPITFSDYWFVTAYLVLMLFSPFINKVISVITRKQYIMLNCIMLVLWSITPTLTTLHFFSNQLTQFLMFYMFGAYVRLYPDNFLSKKHRPQLLIAASFALMMLSAVAFDVLAFKIDFFNKGSHWYSRNSFFIILIAVCFLVWFSKLSFNSRMINTVASCAFGVYLIHDNTHVRTVLWPDILNVPGYENSPWMIVHMAVSVAAVFIVCTAIEFVRKKVIEKPLMKLYDKAEAKIKESSLYKSIERKIG